MFDLNCKCFWCDECDRVMEPAYDVCGEGVVVLRCKNQHTLTFVQDNQKFRGTDKPISEAQS